MKHFALLLILSLLTACSADRSEEASPALIEEASPVLIEEPSTARTFTIAVIPDTQNYLDYKRQSAEGFSLDGRDLFIAQMRDIAARDDVAFVASVGDVWQHQTLDIDGEHQQRGINAIPNPYLAQELAPTDKTLAVEIPGAIEGYTLLAANGKPFGVAPGNHDYDAMWSVEGFPPNLGKPPAELTMTPEDIGLLHIGGLDNFRSVFGEDSAFFADKPWYVSSFRGGANSAQVFNAAGYNFLHFALEMAADDPVLAWVESVMAQHPGKPTIITTHDYLDTHGQRRANPLVDLKRVDPAHHNTAQELWDKLLSRHDQIFLVLCGHHHGQSQRVDLNTHGHQVFQVLADYQGRGQAALDAGEKPDPWRGPPGLGDGWYRLMEFDMGGPTPRIRVRTWSSHYLTLSADAENYADWYKRYEHPDLSDEQFLATDDFELDLVDFRQRFGDGVTTE
jgi:hypothetical protein